MKFRTVRPDAQCIVMLLSVPGEPWQGECGASHSAAHREKMGPGCREAAQLDVGDTGWTKGPKRGPLRAA